MSAGLRTRTGTDQGAVPSGWRAVLRGSVAAFAALHLVAAVALWDLEAAGLALLLALALGLRRRLPRTTTAALGALLVNMAAWSTPGTLRNLAGGVTVPVVLLQASLAAAAVVGLVALVADLRGAGGVVGPRLVPALGVLAVVAAGAAASLGEGAAGPRPGDLEVVASGTAYTQERLGADAGQVSVHLRNEDFFWHTFSVPSLDVHLWVPVGGSDRVTFDAPAGTWEYVCEVPGHGTVMRGQLVVGP